MTASAGRTGQETVAVTVRPARRLARASFWLVILLLVQYVLGVAYSLYGTAPTATVKVKLFAGPLIGAHVIVGTLLIVAAIYLVVASIRAGNRVATLTSAVALVSVIGAWVTGSAFTETGNSGASMAMGVLTAVALVCYLINVRLFAAGR